MLPHPPPITYAFVRDGLAIGSAPPCGEILDEFDVLVLTAEEYPPHAWNFPRLKVIYCPLPDGPLSTQQIRLVARTSTEVEDFVQHGRSVLVTCWQGRNRSGLITALALVALGDTPSMAIARVREARGSTALSNAIFVELIERSYRPPNV